MIRLAEDIWVGNSVDAAHADLEKDGIKAILNCAVDLQGTRGFKDGIYYAQCGLVDGPGNPMSAYYSAVLQLKAIINRGMRVLVHCHEGKSRSVAVVLMYLNTVSHRGWDTLMEILRERVDGDLPEPNKSHKEAFNKINWRLLADA